MQLTFGGGEVRRPQTHGQPLSEIQQDVLRRLRQVSLRSVEVGVIVHAAREKGCSHTGARLAGFREGGVACCPYAAADGNEFAKRLMARGLVRRAAPGVWVSTDAA